VTSELHTLILDSYQRLCGAHVDVKVQELFADGQLSSALWDEVEALGLPGLLTDYGDDLDNPQVTALAIAQLTGYNCVPLPLIENMIAHALLHRAGIDVPAGMLALGTMRDAHLDLAADKAVLSGKTKVPWARHARHIVLATQTQGQEFVLLLPTDGAGITIVHANNPAGEPHDRVQFDASPCSGHAEAPGCLDRTTLEMARYRAALMVGAAESALDMTAKYVNERTQFGRPLGKFQAVQQSLAVFAGEVASALSACSLAFSKAEPDWQTVATAKVRADVAASVGCNSAHQAHGGIGVTAEYPLHLRTRRLWSWRAENGSGTTWARRLGEAFIAGGPDNLWPAITDIR
jgi:acyl-CoA dehydrogenase